MEDSHSPLSTKKQVPQSSPIATTIVHLDVDAFYVACELELRPELRNRPLAVSQYNPYGDLATCEISDPARILYNGQHQHGEKKNPNANGSLIAVSYEARAQHVKRNDRGLEAIRKCPELVIIQVPVLNGKASLTMYRDASERLLQALADCMKSAARDIYQELLSSTTDAKENSNNKQTNSTTHKSLGDIKVEKASVDEIYIDISVPVQKILLLCRETNQWGALQAVLTTGEDSAAIHTTVGGLETSQAAIATNSLSKDEIRRGSSLQVEDSKENEANTTDGSGGAAWWSRPFPEQWGDDEITLAIGALITVKARQAIVKKFDGVFTLSAGVSTNKMMAKLASGLKKPNRQTLINPDDTTTLQKLFHPLPIGRIRGLGGKFGQTVAETLQVNTVGELAKVPLATLTQKFEKQAAFLFRTAQGICDEAVTERTKAKCIGAGKTFQGVLSIRSSDHEKLKKWLGNLVSEILERMRSDKTRYAKTLVCWLNLTCPQGSKGYRKQVSLSATIPRNVSEDKCTTIALRLAKDVIKGASNNRNDAATKDLLIVGMAVTATNFVSIAQGSSSIADAFKRSAELSPSSRVLAADRKSPTTTTSLNNHKQGSLPQFKSKSKTSKSIATFLKAAAQPNTETILASLSDQSTTAPVDTKFPGQLVGQEPQFVHQTETGLVASTEGDTDFSDHVSDKQMEAGTKRLASVSPVECEATESQSNAQSHEKLVEFEGEEEEEVDPDLEYAKQLQASFDRENAEISRMEERRSISKPQAGGHMINQKHKRRRVSSQTAAARPISSFFTKKLS